MRISDWSSDVCSSDLRPPARLEQEVDAAGLVLRSQIGMVATPGSTGIGEDQDTLGAVHEGLGFSDIGARRPGLEFLTAIAANDQPARATGDFRHLVDTEAFDDGIKRSGKDRKSNRLNSSHYYADRMQSS